MKKLTLPVLICIFVLASAPVYAAQRQPLGSGNVALKVDYINFTDDEVENSDIDKGAYIGVEGFAEIMPNLYLGGEVGYANPDGEITISGIDIDTELTFVPVEINFKYAVETVPNLVVDFGAGASYNYVKEKAAALGVSATEKDWLFGGQFFIDINFVADNLFMGINGKYQVTEDFEDFSYGYTNWRIGGQVGFIF